MRRIAYTLHAADLIFSNLECTGSDTGRNLHHCYSLRTSPRVRVIERLKFAGLPVLSLANCHIDDWDRHALLDTQGRLREAGIQAVGAGANDLEAHHPMIIDLNRTRLAFLAYMGIDPDEGD